MGAVYGVGATKIAAMTPADLLSGPYAGNKSVSFIDKYTAAALADGSTIVLGPKLPIGAVIIDWKIESAALGGSSTLALGNAASGAALLAAYDSSSAAKKSMNHDGVAAQLGYLIDAANKQQIIITLAGAAATGLITFSCTYIPKA